MCTVNSELAVYKVLLTQKKASKVTNVWSNKQHLMTRTQLSWCQRCLLVIKINKHFVYAKLKTLKPVIKDQNYISVVHCK